MPAHHWLYSGLYNFHGTATTGTGDHSTRLFECLPLVWIEFEQVVKLFNQRFAIRVQQAIISGTSKSTG